MMNEQGHRKLFLDQVCLEVRAKDMHDDIREELSGHLEELIQDRQAQGYPQAESEAWAVAQMGDPRSLGKTLNRVHKPRMNWGLLGVVLIFAALSLIAMLSVDASADDAMRGRNLFQRQSVYVVIGLVVMTGLYFVDFRKLQRLAWPLYLILLNAMIISSITGSSTINGRLQFLSIGIFNLTSWIPYLLGIALAGILTGERRPRRRSILTQHWLEFVAVLLPIPLLAASHSFPELIIYSFLALIIYIWCTGKWRWALGAGVSLLVLGSMKIWKSEYFQERMISAFQPQAYAKSNGYLYIQVQNTVSSAGWWGQGFGSTMEIPRFIHSDMLPVYLVNCFGWGGGLLLLGMVLWFTARLVKALHLIREPFGKALVLTLGSMLVIRLLYGLSIVSGKMVLSSIAFPFLSYGGHVIIEFAAVGLLLGIYRRKDMIPTAPIGPIK
ncbi:FtsW/RodA/SpoVE family cell cycle protein [Paenibacillus agri]|uniref:FtsW/RodA/SpoVE family cell cycle protein n=1 Tax=Paenibacillus agri TaxID=2744309 RepID=A0A850EMC4_9BACL|nr:FtsW/RodA/SpoVE family cell cycle protein [Paenibacillus agri]NUU62238.1 FtsW/RodA/SpoVE family cell cycle protein [Paenibacillus agri]